MENNRLDNYLELKDAIVEALQSMPLRGAYIDEQRDLQPHVHEVINSVLNSRFGTQFGCIVSIGAGAPKPNIRMMGTSFWPDIEVCDGNVPVLGIELKFVNRDRRASSRISETLGQALIYKLRYPHVIAMIVHYGNYDLKLSDKDNEMKSLLKDFGIDLVLRRPSDPV